MKEAKTKEQLYKLATESKDLLTTSDETKVREKVMFIDNLFKELEYSILNLYSDPVTTFIYSDIIHFRANILRPYFQSIEAEAAEANKPVLIYKREIAKFEYLFKSKIFLPTEKPFYELDEVLTVQNSRSFHFDLVKRVLKCDFQKDWRTTENHVLFSYFVNMAFLIGLYKRLDKVTTKYEKSIEDHSKIWAFYIEQIEKEIEKVAMQNTLDKYGISESTFFRVKRSKKKDGFNKNASN